MIVPSIATTVGVQCTAGLMLAVKQTKPSRTCPLVPTLVPTLRPVDWDMASCNTSLEAMAKRMPVQLIFFFSQFWPKQSHKLCSSFRFYKNNMVPPHRQKEYSCLSSDLQPGDANLSILLAHRTSLVSSPFLLTVEMLPASTCHKGSCTSRSFKGTGLKALHVLFGKSEYSKA